MAVRAGYFGVCVNKGRDGRWSHAWACASSGFELQSALRGIETDPVNAIDIAARFKDNVVFPGLL